MAMYIASAGGEKTRSLQGPEMHTQYDLVIGKYREGELQNRISATRLYVFLPGNSDAVPSKTQGSAK